MTRIFFTTTLLSLSFILMAQTLHSPTGASASDGTYVDYVELKWDNQENTEFIVLRKKRNSRNAQWEEVVGKEIPFSNYHFKDKEAEQGEYYDYAFSSKDAKGNISTEVLDIGYRKMNQAIASTSYFPTNGKEIVGEADFAWSPVLGSQSYRLVLAKANYYEWNMNTGLVGEVLLDITLKSSFTTIDVSKLGTGDMVWSVQAIDNNGQGIFSSPQSIYVYSDEQDAFFASSGRPALQVLKNATATLSKNQTNIQFTLKNTTQTTLMETGVIALFSKNNSFDTKEDIKIAEQAFNPIAIGGSREWNFSLSLPKNMNEGYIILIPINKGNYVKNGEQIIAIK